MKYHFNSIEQNANQYIYRYHAMLYEGYRSTLWYFSIAGIIGSFGVVKEKGWQYLIPFWIFIYLLSKVANWVLKKWIVRKNYVEIKFTSNLPHYVMTDVLWILGQEKQYNRFRELIKNASENWEGGMVDISAGRLCARRINKANLTRDVLEMALYQQTLFEKKWSEETGRNYPHDEIPWR